MIYLQHPVLQPAVPVLKPSATQQKTPSLHPESIPPRFYRRAALSENHV